jgi:hypothetical protein
MRTFLFSRDTILLIAKFGTILQIIISKTKKKIVKRNHRI